MSYYVYENLVRNKAIVHRGDCGSCKEGKGLHEIEPNDKHIWHSGFTSIDGALSFAKGTGRADVRVCAHCVRKER